MGEKRRCAILLNGKKGTSYVITMRANKKTNLLDCLESLNHINDQLVIITVAERQEILPLCQKMAVEIGNTIEYWEGIGTKAVLLLERYCEELYQIYIGTEGLDLAKACQNIKGILSCIKAEIENIEIYDETSEICFDCGGGNVGRLQR